eukprot:jgi/Bigna1/75013/fgenesh1_pg.32_\
MESSNTLIALGTRISESGQGKGSLGVYSRGRRNASASTMTGLKRAILARFCPIQGESSSARGRTNGMAPAPPRRRLLRILGVRQQHPRTSECTFSLSLKIRCRDLSLPCDNEMMRVAPGENLCVFAVVGLMFDMRNREPHPFYVCDKVKTAACSLRPKFGIQKGDGLSQTSAARTLNSVEFNQDLLHPAGSMAVLKCCGMGVESTALTIMFLSALLFSVMGVFVKLAAESGVPAFQLVFMRATAQGVVVLSGLFYYKVPTWFGEHPTRKWVLLRGVLGGCGFCCYFFTIVLLPIGGQVVTVVVARIMLGEPITILKATSILLSAGGAILVAQPSFLFDKGGGHASAESHHPYAWIGYLTAMGGSLIGGCLFVIVRKAKAAHLLNLLWSWVVGSMLISFVLANTVSRMTFPSKLGWVYIAGMCTFGTFGHFMMNYAGQKAPAGPSALLRSTDVAFAYLWEFVIFKTQNMPTKSFPIATPSSTSKQTNKQPQAANGITILGVCMIGAGILLVAYSKYQERRGKSALEENSSTTTRGGMVDEEEEEKMEDSQIELGEITPVAELISDGAKVRRKDGFLPLFHDMPVALTSRSGEGENEASAAMVTGSKIPANDDPHDASDDGLVGE